MINLREFWYVCDVVFEQHTDGQYLPNMPNDILFYLPNN